MLGSQCIIMASHSEGKEAVEVPVDKCRTAIVSCTGGAFPDDKRVYLEYIVGNKVDGSTAGITDYNSVVNLTWDLVQLRIYGRVFFFLFRDGEMQMLFANNLPG
jgi:hypothetical protein